MIDGFKTCITASALLMCVGVGAAAQTQTAVVDRARAAGAAPVAPIPLDQAPSNRIVLKLKPGVVLADNVEMLRNAAQQLGDPLVLRDIESAGLVDVERLFNAANVELAQRLGLDRYVRVRVRDGAATADLADAMGALVDLVEHAEVDGAGFHADLDSPTGTGTDTSGGPNPSDIEPPNDVLFPVQYSLHNNGQSISGQSGTLRADVNAVGAWNVTVGSADTIIAVLDLGVSMSHPDLVPKLLSGYDFWTGTSDTDNNTLSHGTHVAGIAAAIGNNGTGIAGMNWNARILPVKIASSFGASTESYAAQGIVYAVDNGADVISISMSYNEGTQVLADACTYAHDSGVIIVAAAGNSPTLGVSYPAAFPDVIAVGATDNLDLLANFSATGPEVTVVAPGVAILSTWDTWDRPDTYSVESGTSMATPLVAGIVSLIMSEAPWLDCDEVRDILVSTAKDLGDPGFDELYGYGRVDAGAALALAHGLMQPCFGDVTTQGASVGDDGYGVGDGLTTAADINYFVNIWIAGDLEADLTTQDAPIGDPNYGEPDGIVTGADLFYFVNFWILGCP